MTPVQKAVWLTALRSGAFKQSAHALKNADGYCCLGVANEACDLGVRIEAGMDEYLQSDPQEFIFLPKKLQQALATSNDGYCTQSSLDQLFRDAGYLTHPAVTNLPATDGLGNPYVRASFAAIADWIEHNVQPDEVDHRPV